MPLRARLESQPETLREIEIAAEERYLEAQALWVDGYGGSSIYLLGYTAEMLLKYAYFRLEGALPGDIVGPRLGPARIQGRLLCPELDHEHFHSLYFWALLIRQRRRQRNPLPPLLDASFVQRTRRLYQNWWVTMRYRQDQSLTLEVQTVFDDVSWLREHYTELWR